MPLPFDSAIQHFKPDLPLAIGLSGGADSTALLIACAQRWPGQVQAFHIHHGLQQAADGFEQFCRTLCESQNVPLLVSRVNAKNAEGQSPEDAARQARYGAFEVLLAQTPTIRSIALAQHADDQVETLLLALSRGAGVAGLAAMPGHWQRAGLEWFRPLLAVPGQALRDWLRLRGLSWIEDPTNADPDYTRNRIRAQLLPVLEQVFPQFRNTFARSSAHCAQASELLNEQAAADLQMVGVPPAIKALQRLSEARLGNVLRYWLRVAHGTTPTAAQLAQLMAQLGVCTTRGHRIHIKVGRGFVERQGASLGWYNS